MTTTTEHVQRETTLANIAPELRDTIQLAVETHQQAAREKKAAEETMALACEEVRGVLDVIGVKHLRAGDVPITLVEGTTRTLNKLKFVELGGSLAMLENATVSRPKKAYVKIGSGSAE